MEDIEAVPSILSIDEFVVVGNLFASSKYTFRIDSSQNIMANDKQGQFR